MYIRGIKTYIPLNKTEDPNNYKFNISEFKYIEDGDYLLCPNNEKLLGGAYRIGKGSVKYSCKKSICSKCKFKERCTDRDNKILERKLNFKYTDKQNQNVGTPRYYQAMRLRKIWSEGNFSHQKANHNLNNLKRRGIVNTTEHCLLSACALNLKRLVRHLKSVSFNGEVYLINIMFQFFSKSSVLMACLFVFVNRCSFRESYFSNIFSYNICFLLSN